MSIKHARWALKDYVEHLECNLEGEGMGRHQREHWEHQLKAARMGLDELVALERAAHRYMQGHQTADEARKILSAIAKECQTPVPESGEEGR